MPESFWFVTEEWKERKGLLGLPRRIPKQEADVPEEKEKHRTHQNIKQKMSLKSSISYDLRVKKKVSATKLPSFES